RWPTASRARPAGPLRAVEAPEMVVMGATLPDNPAVYSVTELPPWLAANRCPPASRARPSGWLSPVEVPEMVVRGAALPDAWAAYCLTEGVMVPPLPPFVTQIRGAPAAGVTNTWSAP